MQVAQSEKAYEGVDKYHTEKLKRYLQVSASGTSEHLKII